MNYLKFILFATLLALSSTSFAHWKPLFSNDLSNANFDKGVWQMKDGILTANEDKVIWTKVPYENFIVDLEFKTESGANSGILVYCSDTKNWIPNSVEIQLTDDFHPQWAKANKTWQCGAIFGHLAPSKSCVKKPGEWNKIKVFCQGQKIKVVLNGQEVSNMDMSKWTSATTNPDGSKIPSWLSTPFSKLATEGYIGLQGKHAGAKVYFRNMKLILLH